MRDRFAAGLAVGLAVALGAVLVERAPLKPAFADSPSANNEFLALLGNGVVQGEHEVVLFDTKSMRLMVYDINTKGEMSLLGVRNVGYEAKLEEFGTQKPTVKEMFDKVKASKP